MNYWEATLDGAAARAKKTPRWSCCQCTQDKEDSTRELLPGGTPRWSCCLWRNSTMELLPGGDSMPRWIAVARRTNGRS
jgi:hypothetical protein